MERPAELCWWHLGKVMPRPEECKFGQQMRLPKTESLESLNSSLVLATRRPVLCSCQLATPQPAKPEESPLPQECPAKEAALK